MNVDVHLDHIVNYWGVGVDFSVELDDLDINVVVDGEF